MSDLDDIMAAEAEVYRLQEQLAESNRLVKGAASNVIQFRETAIENALLKEQIRVADEAYNFLHGEHQILRKTFDQNFEQYNVALAKLTKERDELKAENSKAKEQIEDLLVNLQIEKEKNSEAEEFVLVKSKHLELLRENEQLKAEVERLRQELKHTQSGYYIEDYSDQKLRADNAERLLNDIRAYCEGDIVGCWTDIENIHWMIAKRITKPM